MRILHHSHKTAGILIRDDRRIPTWSSPALDTYLCRSFISAPTGLEPVTCLDLEQILFSALITPGGLGYAVTCSWVSDTVGVYSGSYWLIWDLRVVEKTEINHRPNHQQMYLYMRNEQYILVAYLLYLQGNRLQLITPNIGEIL